MAHTPGHLRRRLARRMAVLKRRRDEAGYAAVIAAMLFGTVFVGMAAVGVDTANWYREAEHIQRAADAAALAGVTYMPNEFAKAQSTAIAVAAKNGYPNSGRSSVSVAIGSRPSELKVTITMKVDNFFGGAIGVESDWISRSATADFTAPAPMGSPCNTFGNEPPPGTKGPAPSGTALPAAADRFPNCPVGPAGDPNAGYSSPKLWAGIEGPETDKLQGDRYQARKCNETSTVNTTDPTFKCSASINAEYKESGYYLVIRVEDSAKNQEIDIQVYDPAFVPAGLSCNLDLVARDSSGNPVGSTITNTMNDWVTDGVNRYSRWKSGLQTGATVYNAATQKFCAGDSFVGSGPNVITSRATTTTYQMRNETETNNPDLAPAMTACPAKQFRGFMANQVTANAMNKSNGAYNDGLAEVFHQWVSVCKFTPTSAGDYFLQVRTNVSLGGTGKANTNGNNPVIYSGNAAADDAVGNTYQGSGANAFSVRAVPATSSTRDNVSVSAWERLPILQIAASPAEFNLVRALPNAKGQYLTFSFYDAADGANGTVKVLPPPEATGSVMNASGIPGCKAAKNDNAYTNLNGCEIAVQGSNTDGQLISMVIPIPNDYSCGATPMNLGHCWFRVRLSYGTSVSDFTTWSANIGGDPVRLIQ